MKKRRGPRRQVKPLTTEATEVKPYMAIEDAKKVQALPVLKVAEALRTAKETAILVKKATLVLGRSDAPKHDRANARSVLFEQAAKMNKALELLNWNDPMEVSYADCTGGTSLLPRGIRNASAASK